MTNRIQRTLTGKKELFACVIPSVLVSLILLSLTGIYEIDPCSDLIVGGIELSFIMALALLRRFHEDLPYGLGMTKNAGLWCYIIYCLCEATHPNDLFWFLIYLPTLYLVSCVLFEKGVRAIEGSLAASCAFVVVLCLLGVLPDLTSESVLGTGHSLGFYNPNTLGLLIFFLTLFEWLGHSYKKIPFLIATVILSLAGFWISGCRTACIMLMILAVLEYGVDFIGKHMEGWLGKIFILFPWILLASSFAAGFVLIHTSQQDTNFCSRFVEAVYAIHDMGMSLLPQDFSLVSRHYYFDNYYISSFFQSGILLTVGKLSVFSFLNDYIVRRKNAKMLVCAVCIYLYLCMESISLYFSWVIFAYVITCEIRKRQGLWEVD